MKTYKYLIIASILGVLLVAILAGGLAKAQESIQNKQGGLEFNGNLLTSQQGERSPVEWPSSMPVPEGLEILSPPEDRPMSGVDADIEATYNASLRVTGSALKPRGSGVDWVPTGGGGCIYASAGDAYLVFNTPIYLPQGSVVKYFRMYYNDANVTMNTTAWFTVYDLYGDIVAEYPVSSTGTGEAYATTSEITQTIDYAFHSYVINWRPYDLGSDMQVCGFRLYYAAPPGPVYMPLLSKDLE